VVLKDGLRNMRFWCSFLLFVFRAIVDWASPQLSLPPLRLWSMFFSFAYRDGPSSFCRFQAKTVTQVSTWQSILYLYIWQNLGYHVPFLCYVCLGWLFHRRHPLLSSPLGQDRIWQARTNIFILMSHECSCISRTDTIVTTLISYMVASGLFTA
jgi:hypothetical protein